MNLKFTIFQIRQKQVQHFLSVLPAEVPSQSRLSGSLQVTAGNRRGKPAPLLHITVAGSLSVGASFIYAKRYFIALKIPAAVLTAYQLGLGMILLAIVTDPEGMENIFIIS